MNLAILQSIAPIIQEAEYVKINDFNLEKFCNNFQGLGRPSKLPFTPVDLNSDDKIQLDFAYNATNFCYWNNLNYPKWTINYQGKEISGAYGMKAAFNRALEEGFPLTDANFLENIEKKDLAQIVRGNVDIPLFEERLYFLRQAGIILNKYFDGKVKNIVDSGEGDSIKLLEVITRNFPCYDDSEEYNGRVVLFHKRAQLFVHNTYKTLQKKDKELSKIEQLTALADYKVPQLLRNRGILEYNPELSNRIDNYQIIPVNSPEEIEIRAFTIEAIERMVKQLKPGFPTLKAIELDKFIYLESKKKLENIKPYHRTLTTAY